MQHSSAHSQIDALPSSLGFTGRPACSSSLSATSSPSERRVVDYVAAVVLYIAQCSNILVNICSILADTPDLPVVALKCHAWSRCGLGAPATGNPDLACPSVHSPTRAKFVCKAKLRRWRLHSDRGKNAPSARWLLLVPFDCTRSGGLQPIATEFGARWRLHAPAIVLAFC